MTKYVPCEVPVTAISYLLDNGDRDVLVRLKHPANDYDSLYLLPNAFVRREVLAELLFPGKGE